MLSQKIEGVLGMVRTLKEENARIRHELSAAQAVAQDKSLLLDAAKNDLADCKAALDSRANQVDAQSEILNQREAEISALNEKTTVMGQQLTEKDGCIESLNAKIQELNSAAESLNGQLGEKSELLNTLNAQMIEKEATVASLMTQLNEKNNVIEGLNAQLQAQNDEIAEAQEKFNQLVATIESELGTDIELDQGEDSQGDAGAVAEPAAVNGEPQVDESVSQETEDDVPTIEVHGADETDNNLFASDKEGSQTSFFG